MKRWVHHGRRLLGAVALAATVMTGASPVPLAAASPAPSAAGTTGAGWTDVPYPRGAESAASIEASYASGQVSWHVGMQLLPATGPASRTTVGLVLRCDGTVCRHLEPPQPAPPAGSTTRYVSVGGSGPDDVWIGGDQSSPADEPVLWHWDGDAWTELTVPANPGTDGATVYGLSSRTAGEVYVLVRTHRRSTVDGSLALHLVTSPGPAWRRLPVAVPGCVSAPRDVYFSRDVSQLAVAGGELVQTGTCQEQLAQGPGRTIGYAAVGAGAAWRLLPTPRTSPRDARFRAVAAGPGDAWFALRGDLVLHRDRRGVTTTRLPSLGAGATPGVVDDVDGLAVPDDDASGAWAVGRAGGRTALWHHAPGGWVAVTAPDDGTDGRRSVVVLSGGTPLVVDSSRRYPRLSLRAASDSPRTTRDDASPVDVPAVEGPGWATQALPVRADGVVPEPTATGIGSETWVAGSRLRSVRGLVLARPTVARCGIGSCLALDPPVPASAGSVIVRGIVGSSPDDVWVWAWSPTDGAVVLHWDGARWSRREPQDDVVSLLAVSPTGDAWAVAGSLRTRFLHWTGSAWRETQVEPLPYSCQGYSSQPGRLEVSGPLPLLVVDCANGRHLVVLEFRDGLWRLLREGSEVSLPTAFDGLQVVMTPGPQRFVARRDGVEVPFPQPVGADHASAVIVGVSPDGTRLWATSRRPYPDSALLAAWSLDAGDSSWVRHVLPAVVTDNRPRRPWRELGLVTTPTGLALLQSSAAATRLVRWSPS